MPQIFNIDQEHLNLVKEKFNEVIFANPSNSLQGSNSYPYLDKYHLHL